MSEIFKTTAICTRVVEYRENDRLLELCTLEHGKITAVARGAKKANAKLKFAATPFCFGDYMLTGKNGKYIVCDCVEIESFSSITEDLDSYYVGFAMLEALSKTLLNDHANSEVVLVVVRSLKAICFDGAKPYAELNHCLLSMLDALGYNLDFSTCSSCDCKIENEAVFTSSEGIICKHCSGYDGIKLSANILDSLNNPRSIEDESLSKTANILLRDIVYLLLNIQINCLKTAI